MLGDELRALRVPKRPSLSFPRGVHRFCTVSGLAKLIERAGIAAKIGFKVHPNMLRHAAVIELQRRQLASPAHCGVCWRKQTRRLRTPTLPPLLDRPGVVSRACHLRLGGVEAADQPFSATFFGRLRSVQNAYSRPGRQAST